MAKKSAKASKNDGNATSAASDEEILRQRRRMEAVQTADLVLLGVSWALWLLAGLWYFAFQDLHVPAKLRWLSGTHCLEDAVGNLLVCGHLLGTLARPSGKPEWSAWRKPWYLAWVVAFAWLAFLFFQAGSPMHAGLCGILAFTMLTTCPAAAPEPSHQAPGFVGARALLCLDAFALLVGAAQEVATTPWHRSSAALATSLASLPLLMLAAALLCSTAESEMLSCVPTVLLQLVSSGVSCVMRDDYLTLALLVLLFLLHAALYLPLPSNDPESNPFYNSFKRSQKRCVKFMSQPVSGFGDENN